MAEGKKTMEMKRVQDSGKIYTIKEAAKLGGLSEDTIRYYEKIGVLPQAERKNNTHRFYRMKDIETMKMLVCLKKTGMSLDEIRPFIGVSFINKPSDYPELVQLMLNHKQQIRQQIADLQQVLDFIDDKLKITSFEQGGCPQ
ncbi:MerR family transcriptional regulator [Paenibacillus sp. Leaf72]|uniref:MerR family transcriptional regulator n=1 Tax=Paenibacillus sp. Leaf72 TaxID=1736234 RepID=UPI0007C7A25B|nr:MerR family transcriptional regulator [Paenibacillus sp. Leaf72]